MLSMPRQPGGDHCKRRDSHLNLISAVLEANAVHPGAANLSNGLKLSIELVALVRQNGKCSVGVAMKVCGHRAEGSHYKVDIMHQDRGER